MVSRLEEDLQSLLVYFGEKAGGESKPEDLFGTVVSFSGALLRAADEVEQAEARLQNRQKERESSLRVSSLSFSRFVVCRALMSFLSAQPPSSSLWSVAPPQPSIDTFSRRTLGRGGLDEPASRDPSSGASTRRRAPPERTVQRPLSRMFLDGSR